MIKNIIILISSIILSCKSTFQSEPAQVNTQSYKVEVLSKQEAKLLNDLLENQRDTFDFHEKKTIFISGSSGNRILSKDDFFDNCIKPWLDKEITPDIFMIKLTQKEKELAGGCDVLVLSWVKVFTKRKKKKILKEIYINNHR